MDALGDHHTIKIIPLSIPNLRWMKDDSNGGRKDRKIELGVRGCGRDMGKHKNTIIFHQGKEFHFNNTTFIFVYNCLSYRKKEREVRLKDATRQLHL